MKFQLLISFILVAGIAFADELTSQLDDHFRIFMIKPDRRSVGDRITVTGDSAVIYYWESLKNRKPDEAICDAYAWLLLGRTTYGKGAVEAFNKFPSLQQIDISFYEIDFSTKKGTKHAEILPTQNVFEYIRIGVKKDSLSKKSFDRKNVQKMIDDHQCAEIGKTYIDSVAINAEYLKSKK